MSLLPQIHCAIRSAFTAGATCLLAFNVAMADEQATAAEQGFRPDELAAMSLTPPRLRGDASLAGEPPAAVERKPVPEILAPSFHSKNEVAPETGPTTSPVGVTPSTATAETNAHKKLEAPIKSPGEVPEEELARLQMDRLKGDLEGARYLRATRQASSAVPLLEKLLMDDKPETIRQSALLELAYGAQDLNELSRAQTIYSQFVSRWPTDGRVPEVLLRLGHNFREMGLNSLALAKYYAVMTAALSLKSDQLPYYQKLVFQAQSEIAETNYRMGKFADAADFYARLLKQNDPGLDRPQAQYCLIRSLAASDKFSEAAQQAQDFLNRYRDAPQQPEVRFLFAQALKQTSRNSDALQQVLVLLQEQRSKTKGQPEVWAYWQQRAGNEIGNQLYRDGDYPAALSVYLALVELDAAPTWRLPVTYQVAMTYERLLQPAKAIDTYNTILAEQSKWTTNATPNLKAVFEMARWRSEFLQWQTRAHVANQTIANPPPLASISSLTNASSASVAYR